MTQLAELNVAEFEKQFPPLGSRVDPNDVETCRHVVSRLPPDCRTALALRSTAKAALCASIRSVPDTLDDIFDDLFHGCALAAFVHVSQATGAAPHAEATRALAYQLYEDALATKNGGQPQCVSQ